MLSLPAFTELCFPLSLFQNVPPLDAERRRAAPQLPACKLRPSCERLTDSTAQSTHTKWQGAISPNLPSERSFQQLDIAIKQLLSFLPKASCLPTQVIFALSKRISMGLLAKATTEQVVGGPLPLTHIHTQTSQGIKLGQQHQPETDCSQEETSLHRASCGNVPTQPLPWNHSDKHFKLHLNVSIVTSQKTLARKLHIHAIMSSLPKPCESRI